MAVKNKDFLYLVSVIVAFGSFVFGYALVCISMMSDRILQAQPNEERQFLFQLSLITTLLPLGAFLGICTVTHPLCDRFGENKTMLILDVLGTIAIVLQAAQIEFWSLYIGRLLLGVYVGVASGIIPTYLISISPPEISGVVGSLNQLLITIGIATAYGLGMLDLTWRAYMLIPALFCVVRFLTLLFFKFDRLERHYARGETAILQQYLDHFYENCTVEQLGSLRSFSSSSFSSQQISEIKQQQAGCSGIISKLSSNSPAKVIKLAIVLAIANQFSGINAIIFYAKQVFQHITLDDKEQALRYTFYLGILQVVVTFFGGFLINRFGRRTLMLVGESIIVASLLCGFFFGQMKNSQNLITLVVFTHIIGFSISLGPVSMMYVAEMMENITLVVCCVWTFTLFVSMVSEIMISAYGIGNVFLFYGIISSLCLLYLCANMAESKGLTRRELIAKIQGDHEGAVNRDQKDEETGNSPL